MCFSPFLRILICLLVAANWQQVECSCSMTSGPAGQFDCISIDRYSGKQYATCLTNKYIQLKSKGRHICSYRYATYCYYQCMMELHDVNSGTVTPDCSCEDSTGVTPTPGTPGTTLPPHCYSPSGEDCRWYVDCLERKVSCGPQTGYALAFGKKYCELYSNHYAKFSALTQRWVDAVRKCLQVSLVPLMRDFYHPDCDEIKTTAISHHTDCYMSPSEGKPSICDVFKDQCKDVLSIFLTIKGAFIEKDLTVTFGTWKSFIQVSWRCGVDFWSCAPKLPVYVLELLVEGIPTGRSRRSTTGSDPGNVAVFFATALADNLGWRTRGIEWIPLTSSSTPTGGVRFRLLIGDQREFDLNKNYSHPIDMQAEMRRLRVKIQSGEAVFSLGDDRQRYYGRQVSECGDANCTEVKSTVTAPIEPKGAGAMAGLPAAILTFAAVLIAVGID